MRWIPLFFLLSGCISVAARITIAADETLMAAEEKFPAFDAEHQKVLSDADLLVYRTTERPKVVASFTALTGAAHVARQAVEAAASGKFDVGPAVAALCTALKTVSETAAVVKWQPPEVLGTALSLCGGEK